MPGLPPSLTQTISTLVQKTFKTNTAQEIIGDAVDMGTNRGRVYHIARLSTTLVFAGGFGVLFTLEPSVSGYFMPIVEQGLPFLGPIASKVAIGFVGAWLGGACGASGIKMAAKEINFRQEGFRNPRLKFTEEDINRIIASNPQYYTNTPPTPADLDGVRQMLIQTRNQIEYFRENGQVDDKNLYKKAFMSAINTGDLSKLAEAVSSTIAANATSQTMNMQTAQYRVKLSRENAAAASEPLPTSEEAASMLRPPPSPTDESKTNTTRSSENSGQRPLLFSYRSQAANLRTQAQIIGLLPAPLLNVLPAPLAEMIGQRMSV